MDKTKVEVVEAMNRRPGSNQNTTVRIEAVTNRARAAQNVFAGLRQMVQFDGCVFAVCTLRSEPRVRRAPLWTVGVEFTGFDRKFYEEWRQILSSLTGLNWKEVSVS